MNRAPKLEDFLGVIPDVQIAKEMVKVDRFVQREPRDGQPATERTEAYLGYDARNLYVVFVAFDREPGGIRGHLLPRDNVFGQDLVEVMLDTYYDRRRAYNFAVNPAGVQEDALWTEGQGFDFSFDTVWHTRGRITAQGFVVWIAIPFKSIRFPPRQEQRWGIMLNRTIARKNELSFWPKVSRSIEGRLGQTGTLQGLQNIAESRNLQFLPYASGRSFRLLDERDPAQPTFASKRAEFTAGMDAKFITRQGFVLDTTVNPDFSQVESDDPQFAVNQRFELFYPEKRPFFLENANYFQTPISLVFTRRIGEPMFGVRFTGKRGPLALGALFSDDESPGKLVAALDPQRGKRAYFTIARASLDVLRQSSVGLLYTTRNFDGGINRVGGVDGRWRMNDKWVATAQAVTSMTRSPQSPRSAGPAYYFQLQRAGRDLKYWFQYDDRSPGFESQPGFIERNDIRRLANNAEYCVRPRGSKLLCWGPTFSIETTFDHRGMRLENWLIGSLGFHFTRDTSFILHYPAGRERLRPQDFASLPAAADFARKQYIFIFRTSYCSWMTLDGQLARGARPNYFAPAGQAPYQANQASANLGLTLRPLQRFTIENRYLFYQLKERAQGQRIFASHVARTKWNWQFSRELSLRLILQFEDLRIDPRLTSLEKRRNINADVLLTYLIHPGTALYLGYNSNLTNIGSLPAFLGQSHRGQENRLVNDGRLVFFKLSYLFRL